MFRRERGPEAAPAAPIPSAAPAPAPGATGQLLRLQQTAGNQAVVALLRRQQIDADAPTVAEVAELDEREEEAGEVEVEDELDAITELTRTEPYVTADGERHHAEVRFEGGDVVAGVHSTWTTVEAIRRALSGAAAVAAGVTPAQVAALFATADALVAQVAARADALAAASATLAGLRPSVLGRHDRAGALVAPAAPVDPVALSAARYAWGDARHALTVATDALAVECRVVHATAWDDHAAVLGPHLMPAGELFKDKAFAGDAAHLNDYATGTFGDPIPIVWYKAPGDYPELHVPDGHGGHDRVAPFGSLTFGSLNFGVAGGNQPGVGWKVQKVAHAGDRGNQQAFNQVLINQGVCVGSSLTPYAKADVDGDHVKDLGFGGADAIDNYWPLDSTINRRAFTGYNAFYQVNFRDDSSGTSVGRTKAIGGMIGSWFTVKAFMPSGGGSVPAESGTKKSGTVSL